MTKVKKIIAGTLISLVTLGGAMAYATDGAFFGKFGGMNGARADFMVNRVSSKLDLTAVQKQNLIALKDTIKTQRESYQKNNSHSELLELLSTPVLDESKVLSMLEERTNIIRQAAPNVVTAIANFTNSLSDEQRANIQKMAKKFKEHRGNHAGGRFGHHTDVDTVK